MSAGGVTGLNPTISVVISTLNEQEALRRSLESTRGEGVEQIVVDGGSRDGTPEVARFLRATKVLRSAPGRGVQMDCGYRAAAGDVVLFLHAGTRLDPGWRKSIAQALARPAVMGGAFRLRFDSTRWVYRILEWGVRRRSGVARMPYGDQGLFVRRRLLDQIGGVPRVPLVEDLDLVRAIRENGSLSLRPERAWVSPRSHEQGALRVAARNQLALVAYALDMDRERVESWYRRRRSG